MERMLLEQLFGGRGCRREGTDFDGRSDYGPFIAAGIPAGGLFTGAEEAKTAAAGAALGRHGGRSRTTPATTRRATASTGSTGRRWTATSTPSRGRSGVSRCPPTGSRRSGRRVRDRPVVASSVVDTGHPPTAVAGEQQEGGLVRADDLQRLTASLRSVGASRGAVSGSLAARSPHSLRSVGVAQAGQVRSLRSLTPLIAPAPRTPSLRSVGPEGFDPARGAVLNGSLATLAHRRPVRRPPPLPHRPRPRPAAHLAGRAAVDGDRVRRGGQQVRGGDPHGPPRGVVQLGGQRGGGHDGR